MRTVATTTTRLSQASLFLLPKPSPSLLSSSLPFFRHHSEIRNGCKKISEAYICRSRSPFIVSESNLSAALPCSLGPNPQLQTRSSNGSRYGDQDHKVHGIPMLPKRRRLVGPPNAYKDDFFTFKIPALTEKPEWWWRTLACVPYLIALQISYTGYLLQPLLEHYHRFGDLIYFVPGAITRLPAWFTMVYSYFVYVGVVKNKDWPHFFRFHVMMGLLLDIALQVLWTASNFFPLIHYEGKFGMYYWAGTGLAFILVLLQCVKSALAGHYADIPFVSNTAFIHTLFNFGG